MRQNGNFAMWEVSPAPTRPAFSSLTSFHYLYIHTHVHPYIHTCIQLSTDSPRLCLFTVQSKVDRQLWQRFLDAVRGDDSNTHHTRVAPNSERQGALCSCNPFVMLVPRISSSPGNNNDM